MSQPLKTQISDAMKAAMKAGDKPRTQAVRLIMAALKQIEVDQRIELGDEHILAALDKMAKQRRESMSQYQSAGRQDLVDQEQFELAVIQEFLPAQLSDAEINQLIEQAISQTGASSMQDMGKLMNELRPKLQGRADMGKVSQQIKKQLNQ